MDPSQSSALVKDQTGKYWIDALEHDRVSVSSSSLAVDKDQVRFMSFKKVQL